MYFKCVFEDGTESYSNLEEKHLQKIINGKALRELISSYIGEDVEDWDWVGGYSNRNTIEVDLQKENLLKLSDLSLVIDDKNVSKLEFLEQSTYEHVVASLSLDNPKNLYTTSVVYFPRQEDEDLNDYDDPYSDEPPDYDYN
jgi:hypothetical protein